MENEIIHVIFENTARKFPESTAIFENSRSITYLELNTAANRIASELSRGGINRGDIIGVYLDASIDFVAAILGVLKVGGVFLPLGTQFPPKRLQTIIEKANLKYVITGASLENSFTGNTPDYPGEVLIIGSIEAGEDRELPDISEVSTSPDNSCYVMTTSGSTGESKLILGCHRGVSQFINWEINEFAINSNVRVSLLAPPTFDVSLRDIFVPLFSGGTLCVPSEEARHNPHQLFTWLQSERISLLHIVPSMFRLLTHVIKEEGLNRDSLPELRQILVAGEPLYGSDVNSWRQIIGNRIGLVNLYGPSETTLAKMYYKIEDKEFIPEEIIPLGIPTPGTEIMIIKDNQLCGINETGEIYIKTSFMPKGYLNSPQLNELSFVVNPIGNNPEDIVYKTGDQGRYLPDGNVAFEGRLDGQVKLYGNRVETVEIEGVLRQHPKVHDATVTVKTHVSGNPRLVGYIIPANAGNPTVESLRGFLSEYLPDYMIPAIFVTLPTFPLTHSGKIDRHSLPDPDNARPQMEQAYIPPSSDLEKDLTAIWCRVLNLEQVGTHDNFFDLGGTSLLAINMVTQIHSSLGIELPVTKLFEFPNINSLALYLSGYQDDQPSYQNARERAQRRKEALDKRKQVKLRHNL